MTKRQTNLLMTRRSRFNKTRTGMSPTLFFRSRRSTSTALFLTTAAAVVAVAFHRSAPATAGWAGSSSSSWPWPLSIAAATTTTATTTSSAPPAVSRAYCSASPSSSSALSSSSSSSSLSSDGRRKHPVSTGLRNLGNTCYLNSQIQCAYHIPLVRSLISSSPEPSPEKDDDDGDGGTNNDDADSRTTNNNSNGNEEETVALRGLRSLFREMDYAASSVATVGSVASPVLLCRMLDVPVYRQQDAQEFWKLLLPALRHRRLSDLYQGSFVDYIVALDGSDRQRQREETFLDLSLDVTTTPDPATTSASRGGRKRPAHRRRGDDDDVVLSLNRMFGEPELLSEREGNGWRPEKGADKVDAHKGSMLRRQGLPPILQLHLKRFRYDWNTDRTSKINDPFSFPLELDMSTIVKRGRLQQCDGDRNDDDDDDRSNVDDDGDRDRAVYDLQAIVVHRGEYGSGHYYSYVRPDPRADTWYRFDDAVVTEVSFEEAARDSFGGDTSSLSLPSSRSQSKGGGGVFGRILRAVGSGGGRRDGEGGNGGSFGFGGRDSNAYVLQYVKRCDIPMLYEEPVNGTGG